MTIALGRAPLQPCLQEQEQEQAGRINDAQSQQQNERSTNGEKRTWNAGAG
jgi:hypothetical protein